MDEMFRLVWKRYRTWDLTSQNLKSSNEGWKRRVMVLALVGTALGTMAPFTGRLLGGGPWPVRIAGVISTLCLALATYFAKELLDARHEERWTRARTAAEAFKSEAYKYIVQAPPYDGPDRASHLGSRLPALESITKGQVPDTVGAAAESEGLPAAWWTIDEYIGKRLTDQINWYRRRAGEYLAATRRGRVVTLILGGLAVLLSAVTGATAQDGTLPAALLGVVTTAGGAIGAYFQASHYEALAMKYHETSDALERRRVEFATTPAADKQQLVADAESIMQAENAAWLTERTATT
jgi:hypothetical protein